jgi:hypothetical protein
LSEARVKRFERWTNTQEAVERGLLKDDAIADGHAGRRPVSPYQHNGETDAERHRPEPINEIA